MQGFFSKRKKVKEASALPGGGSGPTRHVSTWALLPLHPIDRTPGRGHTSRPQPREVLPGRAN